MDDDADKRISTSTKWLMLGVAGFVDFMELLIGLTGVGALTGIISTTISWGIFVPWFSMHGVSFVRNSKHIKSSLIWIAIGWIMSVLPEFTAGVYRNIKIAEMEDEEKAEKESAEKKKSGAKRKGNNFIAGRATTSKNTPRYAKKQS